VTAVMHADGPADRTARLGWADQQLHSSNGGPGRGVPAAVGGRWLLVVLGRAASGGRWCRATFSGRCVGLHARCCWRHREPDVRASLF
jgi:hypothetical protein